MAVPWLLTVPAFDLARARITRDLPSVEPGWRARLRLLGPVPFARGIGGAVKRPGFALTSAGLGALSTLVALGMTYLALAFMHVPGAIWGVRLLAVVPIALGLTRLGLAVRQADVEPEAP